MLHADLTLLLHTHQVADGACFLFTAYTCCMQVLPLLLRTCAAGGTAYPYNARDCLCYCRLVSQRHCLHTLAFHVNVYALITSPPWSIVSFFRPPLQRSPSVVTPASTYCSFPVGGDRQQFRESPFVRPERACLSFVVLLYLPPLGRAAHPRSESSAGNPVIICLLFHLPTFMARGPSGPAYHCLSAQFSPLWRAARPRSERSVGGPVIICLLFILPTFMARGPSGPAYHCLSVQFAPVMALGSSSERALRRQPSYHLPFVSFAHLYGARPEQASFSLPFCPFFSRYGERPERASLSLPSVQFAPVMARGPSSERSLRRRPSYHLPFVSLTHLYGARPERASFSLPFCPIMARGPSGPAYHCFSVQFAPVRRTARPRSERSVGSPVIICLLFHLPTFMARGPSGPAFHCLSAQFSPVLARGPSGPAYHCLLCNLPTLWRAARPRSERSVGGPVIICLLFSLPTFMARGPSGPAFIAFLPIFPPLWRAARPRSGRSVGGPLIICLLFHLPTFMARGPSEPAFSCLSAQFSPVMARSPSRPADRLPLCSICPRLGARLERASLSMPCFSL